MSQYFPNLREDRFDKRLRGRGEGCALPYYKESHSDILAHLASLFLIKGSKIMHSN